MAPEEERRGEAEEVGVRGGGSEEPLFLPTPFAIHSVHGSGAKGRVTFFLCSFFLWLEFISFVVPY